MARAIRRVPFLGLGLHVENAGSKFGLGGSARDSWSVLTVLMFLVRVCGGVKAGGQNESERILSDNVHLLGKHTTSFHTSTLHTHVPKQIGANFFSWGLKGLYHEILNIIFVSLMLNVHFLFDR